MLAMLEGYDGNEIANPVKVAEVVIDLSRGTNSQTTLFSGAMRSLASRWEKRRKRRQLPNGKRSQVYRPRAATYLCWQAFRLSKRRQVGSLRTKPSDCLRQTSAQASVGGPVGVGKHKIHEN